MDLAALLDRLGSIETYTWVALASYAASLISVPFILVQRRQRPIAALAWMLAVIALPWVGLIVWWGIGFNHLSRKRKWRKRSSSRLKGELSRLRDELVLPKTAVFSEAFAADDYGVFPPTAGNNVELLVDGEQAFPSMIEAIERAEQYVHFCFYIWRKDTWGTRFRDALADRSRAGVRIRVLYDDLGSASVNRYFLQSLIDAGARCIAFLPNRILRRRWSVNFRNHRKLMVVDGRVAFIGGINIGDEYASDGWRDYMVRVTGPVIDQIQEVFADDWHFASNGESIADSAHFGPPSDAAGSASCNVVASGPDTESQETLDAFFIALNSARRRVELMTPYFVPNRTLMITLRTLCIRGVDVTLMLPGKLDHAIVQWASRAYYRDLLTFGVRIYEYRYEMLHGKAMVVDDETAFVGSANLDHRSFRLNFEASLFVKDRSLNEALSASFEATRADSDPIHVDDYPEPHGLRALGQAVAQLASPLL